MIYLFELLAEYVYELIIGVGAFIAGKLTRKDKAKVNARKIAKCEKKGIKCVEKAKKLNLKLEKLKKENEK